MELRWRKSGLPMMAGRRHSSREIHFARQCLTSTGWFQILLPNPRHWPPPLARQRRVRRSNTMCGAPKTISFREIRCLDFSSPTRTRLVCWMTYAGHGIVIDRCAVFVSKNYPVSLRALGNALRMRYARASRGVAGSGHWIVKGSWPRSFQLNIIRFDRADARCDKDACRDRECCGGVLGDTSQRHGDSFSNEKSCSEIPSRKTPEHAPAAKSRS